MLDGLDAIRVYRRAQQRIGGEGDAQLAGIAADLLGPGTLRRRRMVRRAQVGAGSRIEQRRAVADRPGDAMFLRDAVPALAGVRPERIASARGLEPEQAAAGSGDA